MLHRWAVLIFVFAWSCNTVSEKREALDNRSGKNTPNSETCLKKPDRGPCRAMMKGYYFDQSERKCKEFVYGGCQGSLPFTSKEDCERLCR